MANFGLRPIEAPNEAPRRGGPNMTDQNQVDEDTPDSHEFVCPLVFTHDKFREAHYFVGRMLSEYHHPEPFRWNLNAFLQALRSVTFMLQKELANVEEFKTWYEKQRTVMRDDPILRVFDAGRVIVVHRGMLNASSTVEAGVFRGRRTLKLGVKSEISPGLRSEDILKDTQEKMIGFLLDEEHSSIDEQIGVRRAWIIAELGDQEVIGLCDIAWSRIGKVVSAAHKFVSATSNFPPEDAHESGLGDASVLLESDIDPDLPRKWGWL